MKVIIYSNHQGEAGCELGTFFDHTIYPHQNWELMQYTGLKDKNGKEIYEGDYLKHGDAPYTVVWKDGAYHLEYPGATQSSNQFTQDRARHFEIIGNIYENPELL